MRARIRALNWSATPLGPLEHWPAELRIAVGICLEAGFPSCIYWGPAAIQIYNDPYARMMRRKHPSGLGQPLLETWPEQAAQLQAMVDQVFAGQTIFAEDQPWRLDREGDLKPYFFTMSFSPIRDASGEVLGLYHTAQETTQAVVADRLLRSSEARILQSIGDAVIVTDADANISRMNPVAETLTGWAEDEARDLPLGRVFRILNETTRDNVESPVDKVKRLGTVVGLANHTILLRRDGTEISIDDSGAPIHDDNGQLAGIVLVFRNIDERRAAERERDALAEQLRQVLEVTTDSVLFIDRTWSITYLNPQARKVSAPSGEVLGKDFWESFPGTVYEGSPYVENYRRAMDQGIAGEFEAFYPEPLNIWVQVLVRPARDGIALFFRDITEHKRENAERQGTLEELHKSEERLRLALSAVAGMGTFDWEVSSDRFYADASFASLFGMASVQGTAEILLDDFMQRIHPEDRNPVEQAIARAVSTGEEYAIDYRVLQPYGAIRWASVRGRCLHSEDGDPLRFIGVILDITERKLTEQALLQTEKLAAVGRLASSIAHEINNPLESITNLLYLARSSENSSEVQSYLEAADHELSRVSVIANQTLRFHKQSTQPQYVSCSEVIRGALSIYTGRLANSNITVEKRKRANRSVLCFEGEIRQVLNNLIGNAIDAMPTAGGRLLIRSREGTDWKTGRKGLIITVADNGHGMSAETRKHIFDAFFTTKDITGTGLGLWVSCEIVKRHNGHLRVRSIQRPGRSGSVFTLFLPFE